MMYRMLLILICLKRMKIIFTELAELVVLIKLVKQ